MRRALVLAVLACVGCTTLPRSLSELAFTGQSDEAIVVDASPSASLPAPDAPRARSGEYRLIPLKWDPVLTGNVAGYVVERSPVADGPFRRLATLPGRGTLAYICLLYTSPSPRDS